jgi:hypothetical protein
VKPYSRKLHIDARTRNALFSADDRKRFAPVIFNGHDVGQRWRGLFALDFFGMSENDIRIRQPRAYQYLIDFVWLFEANRAEMRDALKNLKRFIVTLENSPQRYFVFIDGDVLPDQKLRVFASDDSFNLAVLSSTIHEIFTLRVGGRAGKANTPVYNTNCAVRFPFPAAKDAQKELIGSIGEELDALRKRVLAEHDFLNLTKLYNVREKLKSGEPLDESEKTVHDAGCVSVIHELHNNIDAAVAEAYGWPTDLPDEEILSRLVALNKERAEEENRGIIRWLRPEYQAARAKVHATKEEQIEAQLEIAEAQTPELPKDDADLIATLRQTLRVIGKPAHAKDIAQHFRDGARGSRRVERGLRLLAAAGVVRHTGKGWFLPSDRAGP